MRNDDNRHRENHARSVPRDEKVERAVLALILSSKPKQLSITALASELAGGFGGPEDRAVAERAVNSLVRDGLLERNGILVSPTRPARRFDELGL